MGVIHGLSVNQNKLDVQLNDKYFSKDENGLIRLGTLDSVIPMGSGLGPDSAQQVSVLLGSGLGFDAKASKQICVQVGNGLQVDNVTNKVAAKIGSGLGTDSNSAMQVKIGTGLKFDTDGTLRVREEVMTGGSVVQDVNALKETTAQAQTNIQNLQNNAAQMNKDLTALQNTVNDYHKPFGINLGASPTLLEVGTGTSNVTITWSYNHADVHTIASQKLNSAPVAVGTLKSVQSVPLTAHATKTFTLEASTTKGKTLTKSVNVVINHASYYGVVDAAKTTLSAAEIKALTKKLSTGKALGATSFAQNNQKVVYTYPEYFGNLVSVKNSSGFEGLSGYEKKTVAVDGQNYNLYISKDAATSTDKLTFA